MGAGDPCSDSRINSSFCTMLPIKAQERQVEESGVQSKRRAGQVNEACARKEVREDKRAEGLRRETGGAGGDGRVCLLPHAHLPS